jgi:hypothetical protein
MLKKLHLWLENADSHELQTVLFWLQAAILTTAAINLLIVIIKLLIVLNK